MAGLRAIFDAVGTRPLLFALLRKFGRGRGGRGSCDVIDPPDDLIAVRGVGP
jgi:hypothetical protein